MDYFERNIWSDTNLYVNKTETIYYDGTMYS